MGGVFSKPVNCRSRRAFQTDEEVEEEAAASTPTTTIQEGKLMEDMSPAVALPFGIGNSLCDNPMEITCLKLLTDTTTLLSDPLSPDLPMEHEEDVVGDVAMEEGGEGQDLVIQTLPVSNVVVDDDDDDDDAVSMGPEPSVGRPCSVVSVTSSTASVADDFLIFDPSYEMGEMGMPYSGDAAKSIDANEIIARPANPELDVNSFVVGTVESDIMVPLVVEPAIRSGRSSGSGGRSVFLTDYVPLWGCVSLCGRRPEMEDAVAVLPSFFEVPVQMLTVDRTLDGLNPSLISLPAHFFGVYDGHGGSQVANYSRDSIHLTLIEELRNRQQDLNGSGVDWHKEWEKAFVDCFQKVDDEIGGRVSRGIVSDSCGQNSSRPSSAPSEPVAPETVGSTAVVAVICSSHIIVANCGDSRAVLCRGKQSVPLSEDHKPNREDEYARIEAEGGKVIQWNGYRVFGVLAMSRSIGDRYLKPWIIPVPEVKIIPRVREDECLILASDGLWDVMTNEEACDAARRRILLWHKRNGVTPVPAHRGVEADLAAQAAAEYLTKLALQKGSKDNITVVVVDLKAQRKFKSKT